MNMGNKSTQLTEFNKKIGAQRQSEKP